MSDGTRKHYDESFRTYLVGEIESGNLSIAEASREYGVPRTGIKHWLSEYGRFRPKRDVMEVVMKSEKDRIAELEKALAEAHLKNRAYEELLKQAEAKFGKGIKKNSGSPSSASSSGKGGASKKSAKHSG